MAWRPASRRCTAILRARLTQATEKPPVVTGGFKFRDWCKLAGLPKGLTPHGLRKAFCRVAAEAGLTPHQIVSISGHKTLAEVTRYTAAADRRKLAIEGMQKIEERTGNGNPNQKVSTHEA